MTPYARLGRIGWFAVLAVCTACYLALNFKVHTVSNDVIKSERRIVALKDANMMLQTEFLSRASQAQLAAWNRLDFGYTAPDAQQFLTSQRQLAQFSAPDTVGAPAPIELASNDASGKAPPFPQLRSPITGKPIDKALVDPARASNQGMALSDLPGRSVNASLGGPLRINLGAAIGAVEQ